MLHPSSYQFKTIGRDLFYFILILQSYLHLISHSLALHYKRWHFDKLVKLFTGLCIPFLLAFSQSFYYYSISHLHHDFLHFYWFILSGILTCSKIHHLKKLATVLCICLNSIMSLIFLPVKPFKTWTTIAALLFFPFCFPSSWSNQISTSNKLNLY